MPIYGPTHESCCLSNALGLSCCSMFLADRLLPEIATPLYFGDKIGDNSGHLVCVSVCGGMSMDTLREGFVHH